MAQARVIVFFDISRYLKDKHFDSSWKYQPPGNPQKSIFLNDLTKGASVFNISRYLRDKIYFDIVWECHPRGPPKINILNGLS